MTSSARAIQRKVDIALALAGGLLSDDICKSLDTLVITRSYPRFKEGREKALAQIKEAIAAANDRGQRTEALQAFRILLLDGVFIDSMAVLAVESKIAAFKAEHALPAPATVSEYEQP
ncbi:hypothetical protein UFOVP783_26 [uncultured Caudovirales phage]|uniref:Uncharacterized protein n=1 Tax=uncultured Caudovirales phage TaxID=2100421 RepID=A0A6J5NX95_9CAUD|nr:hypothetical protein UFOVP783_26 [uncultured Caudovirales phage]